MSSVSWSRLIRFSPADSHEVFYGEPVANDYSDIGKLADQGLLTAKVLKVDSEGPLSPNARLTSEILNVGKLLGPLDRSSCTDIKCIGLNYKKHSKLGRESQTLTRSSRRRKNGATTAPAIHQASDHPGRL
jgi:hypothetical protein